MADEIKIGEAEFLSVSFAVCDEAAACEWVLDRSRRAGFSYVITPNVDHIVRLDRERRIGEGGSLRQTYNDADLKLCDSRILALLARVNGLSLPVVTGSDLTARLLRMKLQPGIRIALIGGNEGQRRWLADSHPEAEIFHHEPPMGVRTNFIAQEKAAIFVEGVRPHLTLLTIGSPQSELVAHLIKVRSIAGGVALCVGASLEFLTGEKRRAPRAVQGLGLEWAFRLFSEPRRLWRRYLVDGPAIVCVWRRERGRRRS